MREVFVVSDNVFSPLDSTTSSNFRQLINGISGLKVHQDPEISEHPFCASVFENDFLFAEQQNSSFFTKFENLLVASIRNALDESRLDFKDEKTIFILSTTKGNIGLIEKEKMTADLIKRIAISTSAEKIVRHFGFRNQPLVISNACISGLLAMLVGQRLIRTGQYDHAVIAGADVLTKFIYSGFESFQALSAEPCKPFDAARNGINLGEAAATVILSADPTLSNKGITITGGSVSNDANHISGPSRTGEELFNAITSAVQEAGLTSSDIDFISAHGTGTLYNDEMEAKAIEKSKMLNTPVNSMKGYFGHTLGASGLVESILAIYSMTANQLIPCLGFNQLGVTVPVNVITDVRSMELKHCLKTASGFGGCNAAVVFSKYRNS